ncbi:unnamed protein product [Soboliphyme baturini]|uniref:MAM domain-containing protein n=1 Tax=Soboliphyme baturini TaxID=241478 RepID=A0A183INZ0_9BILA|nr:unnamed protein product [Soboliphyme baturini]
MNRFHCQCGCQLEGEGYIIITSNVCQNLSIWKVKAKGESAVIRWQIIKLDLSTDSEWVKIKNGHRPEDAIIFDSESRDSTVEFYTTSGPSDSVVEYFSGITTNVSESNFALLNVTEEQMRISIIWFESVIDYDDSSTNIGSENSYFTLVINSTSCAVMAFAMIFFTFLQLIYFSRHHDAACGQAAKQSREKFPRKLFKNCTKHRAMHKSESHPSEKFDFRKEADPLITASTNKLSSASPNDDVVLKMKTTEEMVVSTITQTTRLSAISSKSIDTARNDLMITSSRNLLCTQNPGIVTSSTPSSLRRQLSLASHRNSDGSTCNPHLRTDSSEMSIAGTEQDFEYDYYDAPLPGSFLNPVWAQGAPTDADLEQIIEQSELLLREQCSTERTSTTVREAPGTYYV